MKGIMVFLAVVVAAAVAVPVFAKNTFNVDGKEVSVKIDQRGNELTAAGRVSGGEPCKQLNVEVYLDNSKESTKARVEAAIKNYKGASYTGGQTFKASTTARVESSEKYWHVSDIYLNCLQ